MAEKDLTIYKETCGRIWERHEKNFHYHSFLKMSAGGRKFLIWGATGKSDWIQELCEKAGISVNGYIDNNSELTQYNGYKVYRPDILNYGDFFVFVALENKYSEVFWQMERYKLQEFRDYIYPLVNRIVLTGNRRDFFDLNGNEVKGIIDGYRVELFKGSKLIIGKNCKIDKSVSIKLEQNAVLVIGNHCVIGAGCIIYVSGGICQIGEDSHVSRGSTIHLENSVALIGDGFSCGPAFCLGAGQYAVCKIGKDCMFSTDIRIQCSDSHNYFDLMKRENIGIRKRYVVNIGEHVWIGAKSNLLYGTDIGAGSIVGMGSLVTGKFPANVILAGNPAKIVRRYVAWDREAKDFVENHDFFEPYCFCESELEYDKELNDEGRG